MYSASFSCTNPLSFRRCSHRSAVGSVHQIRPLKPRFTNEGIAPQWSMWACESTMASTEAGSTGKLRFRSLASDRFPWNIPQSSRTRPPAVSTRCIDPVTVRTAPQNWRRMDPPYSCAPLEMTTIPPSLTTKRLASASRSNPISIPSGIVTSLSTMARRIRAWRPTVTRSKRIDSLTSA